MDKLNKLQALTDALNVVGEESAFQISNYAKPQHLYEGTDSEDDECIVSQKRHPPSSKVNSNLDPGANQSGSYLSRVVGSIKADPIHCRIRYQFARLSRVSI